MCKEPDALSSVSGQNATRKCSASSAERRRHHAVRLDGLAIQDLAIAKAAYAKADALDLHSAGEQVSTSSFWYCIAGQPGHAVTSAIGHALPPRARDDQLR